jgi:TRAP-type C4-dicarboxylate transport system permease small subunit
VKKITAFLLPWLPFAYAVYLCYSTLWHIARSDLKAWEPAFYSYLPMSFFFVGAVVYSMQREIRELRGSIAKLQAAEPGERAAA